MGQLINGVWKDVWYDTQSTGGHFKRSTAQFRNWVTTVTNGAIVIHTQRLKSDPGGNLLS
ncbi:glutathione S-transferase [Yersinia pestis subsp. microtus bv. Altaica]|uniref:Glutathione S-transferase n=5 Tax=Yersinia pestis TaxID=632 RepID=A0A3G5LAJ2_YERPE